MNLLEILLVCTVTVLLLGVQPNSGRQNALETGQNQHVREVSHIGGAATDVVVQGQIAYVGYAGELAVLDISDVTSPRRIGYTMLSANDLAMGGSHVYVAGAQGLQIVDVATPGNPRLVGVYATQEAATGIWMSGETAYVVTNRGGLHIVHVQDPHRPTRIGFLAVRERLPDIAVAEPYAYIAGNSGLHIVDISDPRQPASAAFLDLPGFAADLTLSGNRLFLTNEFQGLIIVDISDPSIPNVLQTVPLNSMVWDVAILDGTAYVASTEPGMHVIEGVQGMEPTPVYRLQDPNSLWALSISEDKLFGVNMDGDLSILSLTNRRAPALSGTYDAPGYSMHVAAYDRRVYAVADAGGSVYEINAVASGLPTARNLHLAPGFTVSIAATQDGFIASCETLALWAGRELGNQHSCDLIFPAAWHLRQVASSGSLIYGIGDEPGILWVDNTGDKPLRYGTLKIEHDVPRTLVSAGPYVYVGGAKGLYVFTHEAQDTSAVLAFVETPGPIDLVGADEDSGYVVMDSRRFCAMDLTDRRQPKITGCVKLDRPVYGAARCEDIVYVAMGDARVTIVDMKNSAQPEIVGQVAIRGRALDVAATGSTVYVAAAEGGIFVLQP